MFQLHRRQPLAILGFAIAVAVFSQIWISTASAQSQDVTVKVVDVKDAPLLGAEVEIYESFGSLKPTQFKGETDAAGEIRFEGVAFQGHAYLVVRHADLAPVIHFLSIAGQDKVTTKIRLVPAVQAFVEVRSPDGKPLAGAEVTRLEFSSESTGEKHFANHEFFMAMMQDDGSAYQSDAQGRLHLPPLPSDAVLSVTVAHPGFAVGKLDDVKASELAESVIEVKKGTTIEAYLVGEPEVINQLEGERLELRTSNRKNDRLMHSFQVQNGKFEFTLVPGRYDSFYLSKSQDLVITPALPSSSMLAEFANIPDLDRIQKKFVVRELRTVKGRVVTSDGTPVSDLMLHVKYENLYVDAEGEQRVVEEHPTASDIVTTNHEGEYECRLPRGNASISAWWDSGYYSQPDKLELVYEDQLELPDYVVRAMPTLKGVAVDEEGKPVPNAILRLVDHTSNYVFADQEGRFDVPVAVLDYDDDAKATSKFKTLSAFDLGSRLCCIEPVDITDDEAITQLTLKLKPHPADWLLNRLQEISEQKMKRMVAASNYVSEEIEQGKKKSEEIKAKHRLAPDLADGMWLRGVGSRSLSEYRGKYVLLDFWFIGCGPCEREIPNLKLAHEKFKDRNFSVIGVHIAGQDDELVEKYMSEKGMEYPMVIDRFDEPIQKAYEPLGLKGYPTYFLVKPDGEIDWDATIRGQMLETIRDRMIKLEESKSGSEN